MALIIRILLLTSAVALVTALRLCHTNDFHARYVEINKYDSDCSEEDIGANKCFGGIARLATAFKALQCDIRIQDGDFAQGTVYDTIFKEKIAIAGYRWLDYDFATFGNHEFNRGPESVYNTVINTPNVTWISSNVEFADAPKEFKINKHLDMHDICFVSALTTSTLDGSSPGPTVSIANETRAIQTAIAGCKQQKAVIALNHIGFEQDLQMCKDVKDLDLIIGAHTHTNLNNGQYPVKIEREDGSFCWVVQAYAFGRYMGVLDIEFNSDGIIYLDSHQYIPMDFRFPNDPVVAASLDVFTKQLNEEIQQEVAEATAPIVGGYECRSAECQMGNLACDALLAQAGPKQGASLCLINAGGIRDSIGIDEEAPIAISVEDVLSVFPFGNVHYVITLPGSGIISTLEHAFTAVDDENYSGRFPQVGGMVVSADISAPFGLRVQSVTIDGQPIDVNKMYKVVTNSFIGSGGDAFTWAGATDVETSGRALSEITQDYLEVNSPYTPILEGRITLV